MVVYYQTCVRYLSCLSTLSLFVITHNSLRIIQRIYCKNLKTKFLGVKMLNKFIKCFTKHKYISSNFMEENIQP